jgi:hypothetical protein
VLKNILAVVSGSITGIIAGYNLSGLALISFLMLGAGLSFGFSFLVVTALYIGLDACTMIMNNINKKPEEWTIIFPTHQHQAIMYSTIPKQTFLSTGISKGMWCTNHVFHYYPFDKSDKRGNQLFYSYGAIHRTVEVACYGHVLKR